MSRWLIALLIGFAAIAAASAMQPGEQIVIFGKHSSASSPPLTSCPSTGIYDLSNTCNDIYFIGGL
jgi:hypothetical protein